MRHATWPWIALLVAAPAIAQDLRARITLADGRVIDAELLTLGKKEYRVRVDGAERALPCADVQTVELPVIGDAPPAPVDERARAP